MGSGHSACSRQTGHLAAPHQSRSTRFQAIADQFHSVEQVQAALQREGLESCNLIVAVDFTKSNEWTGKHSFNGCSLHQLGTQPNPYEEAMTIIGKTLSKFDDDQLIPAYGFGDVTCQDNQVFSFNPANKPCHGLEAVVERYRQLAPAVRLAGPTSFAPAITRACQIVNDSGGRFHILLLIADGQVTRSSDLECHQLSAQEAATIDALVAASKVPLSVVMVGVGDGPWDMMKHFDDALPTRDFDNFQFVNFTEINAVYGHNPQRKEAQFALKALMEIPDQYKLIQKLRLLGRKVQLPNCPQPLPPPVTAPPAVSPSQNQGGYPNLTYQYPGLHLQQQGSGTVGGLYPLQSSGPAHSDTSNSMGPGDGLRSVPSYPPITGGFLNPSPTAGTTTASAAAAAGGGGDTSGVWGVMGPGVNSNGNSNANPSLQHQQPQQHQQPDPLSDPLFICPITQDVMINPVIAADGYVYEREAIEDWLSRNDRSPMSNEQLRHKELTPNHALRSRIMEAKEAADSVLAGNTQ